MSLPLLRDKNGIISPCDLEQRMQALRASFPFLLTSTPIGLFADLSFEGVALAIFAITSGLKAAFCHTREPPSVLSAWLKELGVTKILSSVFLPEDDYKNLTIKYLPSHDDIHEGTAFFYDTKSFSSIIRTSGSSAKPKSAVIDFLAHEASAKSVNNYFNFNRDSCWALSLPIAHVSGLSIIIRALKSGGGIYIARDFYELCHGIESGHISHCSVVPAQVKRLIKENVNCTKLRALIVGGDKLHSLDRKEALARKYPLYECYGMTETASMILVKNASSTTTDILPHAQAKLGLDNEILVGGQSLCQGYWYEKTVALPLTSDGFFATGDLLLGNNFDQLHLICRKNNRIISGGENIQVEEVEEALEQHPCIDYAVVAGVYDQEMGMRPVAYVKWQNEPIPSELIKDFLKDKLARYKWPIKLLKWPESLPLSQKKPRHYFR